MRYPYRERQNADPAQKLREIVRFENFLKKSVSVGNPIKAFVVIHSERPNSAHPMPTKMSIAHFGTNCNIFLLHKVTNRVTKNYNFYTN